MNKFIQRVKLRYLAGFIFIMYISACEFNEQVPNFDVEEVEGYRPIYSTEAEGEVKSLAAREIESPGKIYVINDYLLVVDKLKGIHVFDNKNPSNPQNVAFIQVVGSNDVAIRNQILYVDQAKDLLAIDISNPTNVKLASRVKNVFPFATQHPLVRNTYYECPDPSKGIVVGWEKATLNYPECYY